MRYLDEYRDGDAARKLLDAIAAAVTRPWTVMEVCGSQTHSFLKYGIDQMLPPRGHAHPRAGLSGLRHAGRDHRPGDCAGGASRT